MSGSTTVTAQQSSLRRSNFYRQESRDVDMDGESFADEDEFRNGNSQSRGRIDEDDDAFFGRMEE
jgi:hypothetical protein